MTKRERFLAAARRQIPDRVPVLATLTPQVAKKLSEFLGISATVEPEDSFLSTRISHVEIVNALGNDAVIIGGCRQTGKETKNLGGGRTLDEMGFEAVECGLYGEIVVRPLADAKAPEDILKYKFPNPHDPGRFALARQNYSKYHKDYAIVGDLEATIFELSWNLIGLEKFLMDLLCEEEYIGTLLDAVTEYNTAIALELVDIGCDMIWLGDDIGMQNAMMFSPETYRKYFKPRLASIIAAIKKQKPDCLVAYHSCGAIRPIIGDLSEIGIDVLNPLQPLAKDMNLAEIKAEYGNKLAFFGAIDVQNVLPNGTTLDVEKEVALRIEQGAEGGGLILAPAHNIQPDTPVENVMAMYQAIEKYGKY